jgi:hypothetical protein
MLMASLLLALASDPTVLHQVLVIELPAEERIDTRFVSDPDVGALVQLLSKKGARVISAPSLVSRENEPAEIDVKSTESSMHLGVNVLKGRTRVDFRYFAGETRLEARAELDLRDGAMFAIPIDTRRILVARQDRLEGTETIEAATKRWRELWRPVLDAR